VSRYSKPGTERVWQIPRLRDDDPGKHHTVGWVELFFDLVFVVVIAVLAGNLVAHENLLEFALQFTAIFWVWNGFTYYNERFESHGLDNRLFTFIAILAVAGLAIWGRNGLGRNYAPFAASYLLARLLTIALWLRAGYHVRRVRRPALGFAGAFVVSVGLITVSALASTTWRLVLFAAAILIEIVTPVITGQFQAGLPPLTRDKYPERFGLFTLIVIGQTVTEVILSVAATNSVSRISVPAIVLAGLGLLVGFGLWWVYFDFIARRPTSQVIRVVLAWIYLHLLMLIGIVVIGVGLSDALAASTVAVLPVGARDFLLFGTAEVLAAVACIELTLEREPDEPTSRVLSPAMKLVTAVAVAGIALSPLQIDAFATLGILIAALGAQAAYAARVYYRKQQP
jgi:low temperature requirement protein LtrA